MYDKDCTQISIPARAATTKGKFIRVCVYKRTANRIMYTFTHMLTTYKPAILMFSFKISDSEASKVQISTGLNIRSMSKGAVGCVYRHANHIWHSYIVSIPEVTVTLLMLNGEGSPRQRGSGDSQAQGCNSRDSSCGYEYVVVCCCPCT